MPSHLDDHSMWRREREVGPGHHTAIRLVDGLRSGPGEAGVPNQLKESPLKVAVTTSAVEDTVKQPHAVAPTVARRGEPGP